MTCRVIQHVQELLAGGCQEQEQRMSLPRTASNIAGIALALGLASGTAQALTERSRQPYRELLQKVCGTLSCTIDFAVVERRRQKHEITNVSCEARLGPAAARMLQWRMYVLAVPGRFIRGAFALPPTLGGTTSSESYLSTNEQVFAVISKGEMPSITAQATPSAEVQFLRCTIAGHLVRYQ